MKKKPAKSVSNQLKARGKAIAAWVKANPALAFICLTQVILVIRLEQLAAKIAPIYEMLSTIFITTVVNLVHVQTIMQDILSIFTGEKA